MKILLRDLQPGDVFETLTYKGLPTGNIFKLSEFTESHGICRKQYTRDVFRVFKFVPVRCLNDDKEVERIF